MTGGAYTFSVWRGEVRHTVIVWNGVRDYCRVPLTSGFEQELHGHGLTIGPRVVVAQIGRPVGKGGRSGMLVLQRTLVEHDSLILWAKNTRVYDSLVAEMRLHSTLNFDGTPKQMQ